MTTEQTLCLVTIIDKADFGSECEQRLFRTENAGALWGDEMVSRLEAKARANGETCIDYSWSWTFVPFSDL